MRCREIAKPRKAQSAMEYLMTYGWAILIIAVVLGALFELGVFGSASSLPQGCIAESGYYCQDASLSTSGVLTLTIGQATTGSFSNVNVYFVPSGGSLSNAASASLSRLQSGELVSLSMQLPTVSPYPSSYALGTPLTGYVYINYTEYGTTQSVEIATLSVKADVSSSPSLQPNTPTVPSGIVAYVPITLSNSKTVATPAPFQQMVQFSESGYSNYINYSGKTANFEFFTASGSVIPAWIESNSSGTITAWLKLANGIPASNSITVYLGFASKTTNLLSSSGTSGIGEAPQISSTYAEYDDGASVFTQYGGKSWSSFTFVGGTWSTTNGYLQQTATTGSYTGGPAALIEGTSYPATGNYVLGMAFNYATEADARVGLIAVATPTTTPDTYGYRFIGQQANNGAGFISFLNDLVAWVANNTYQGAVSTAYTMTITDASGTWSGNLYSGYGTETSTPLTSLASTTYTTNNYEGTNTGYVGISAAYYTGSATIANPINVMWFYMRAYPPDGVMPSVSFGSVT